MGHVQCDGTVGTDCNGWDGGRMDTRMGRGEGGKGRECHSREKGDHGWMGEMGIRTLGINGARGEERDCRWKGEGGEGSTEGIR